MVPAWLSENIIVAALGVCGAFFTFLATRLSERKTAARRAEEKAGEVQSSITTGFRELIDELQEMRRADRQEIQELRKEVAGLRADVLVLSQHVVELEQIIRAYGAEPPTRPDLSR